MFSSLWGLQIPTGYPGGGGSVMDMIYSLMIGNGSRRKAKRLGSQTLEASAPY